VSRTKPAEIAMVTFAALAIATSAPLAKSAEGLSAIGIGAGRCGVAALAIILVMPGRTTGAILALRTKQKLALLGVGLILAAHFALFLGGLLATSLPAAVALVSLEPLAVVLTGWAAFRIRPTKREWIGISLATAGAIVVARGAGEGEHRLYGDLLVVGAVVLYGAYVAAARGLRDAMPVLPYAAAVYGVAALALLPFAVMIASRSSAAPPPMKTWLVVGAMGLLPTLVGHTLIQRLSRRVAPAVVALVSPGETVGSIAIGAIVLGAWPTANEWAGTALVLVGATTAVTSRSPEPAAVEQA
jgi:drug/metabolite transporter (DMT)-like permease